MSDQNTDRYCVTLSDGSEWEYDGMWYGIFWALAGDGKYAGSPPLRTPNDYRKCAEVIERWEHDHAPKKRRRVVRIGKLYYARHETLPGYVRGYTPASSRQLAREQDACDSVWVPTDEDLDALLSLRDQPDEEVPSDE